MRKYESIFKVLGWTPRTRTKLGVGVARRGTPTVPMCVRALTPDEIVIQLEGVEVK